MTQGKTIIFLIVALAIGFTAGFVLRPVIAPPTPIGLTSDRTNSTPAEIGPRGVQYFTAHLEEARQVVAGCTDGAVRGDECANAEQAVIEAEGQERFKRFMSN